jgi:hypothetical protein
MDVRDNGLSWILKKLNQITHSEKKENYNNNNLYK